MSSSYEITKGEKTHVDVRDQRYPLVRISPVFFSYKTLLVSLSVLFGGRCSNPACTDLPTVTIEVDVKNIQYTEDEAELAVSCEVEASPEAKVR
jgi:hypothetical protein